GPVSVDLSYGTGGFPADCDVATVGPFQLELPVSVDVNDDHVWEIHCREPSTHTFTFETKIVNIKEPHVVDPDEGNNSGITRLVVNAIAEA
ncbi:MAG: hypothetical protein GTO22_23805, partial [Gemmatimonadales bacterium]|nr:hypothetical protein [Gemmatimonadales bacterium]